MTDVNTKMLSTTAEEKGSGSPAVPSGNNDDDATGAPVISNMQLCLLILSLFCGTFVMALDATIIGTAVPSITTEFDSLQDIAWYGSGYLLTITAFQPTLGKLYRFMNIKIVFMTCVLVFEGKMTSTPTRYRPGGPSLTSPYSWLYTLRRSSFFCCLHNRPCYRWCRCRRITSGFPCHYHEDSHAAEAAPLY